MAQHDRLELFVLLNPVLLNHGRRVELPDLLRYETDMKRVGCRGSGRGVWFLDPFVTGMKEKND